MRWGVTLATGLALASCGCDERGKRLLSQEAMRFYYLHDHGPTVAISILGAFAPAGQPSVLAGLSVDQGWRTLVGKKLPEMDHVPSMFELPDPNRPIQIGVVNRTQKL